MEFPPLDDDRWDRLLVAVVGQRSTVGDPTAPLAAPFPAPPARPERELDDETIRLDTYA